MNRQQDTRKDKKASVPQAKITAAGGPGDLKRIVLSGICIVIALVLCIGVGVQQLRPKVVLTINNTKLSMNDMMYPIYERESAYLPYDEMYQRYTNNSVWDNSYMGDDRHVDSSLTNAQGLKLEITNAETEYEILYQEALKAGYELSDEAKDEVEKEAADALKGLSWVQRMKLNISKRKLVDRFEKRTLAESYKEDQQKTLNEGVDEKAAVADISKKDYRQYNIQYYSALTTKTDKDGKTTDLSDKEKKKLLEKMEAIEEKSSSGFEDLIDEDEKDITYEETSFTEKNGWSMVSTKSILKEIKSMDNNTVSKIYEDKKAGRYVLVKMLDNNSSEAYDDACDNAVETAQNDAYDKWYEELKKGYTIKENTTVWDDVIIGTVTTDIVTAEDLEKMNADSSDNAASSEE